MPLTAHDSQQRERVTWVHPNLFNVLLKFAFSEGYNFSPNQLFQS